MTKKLIIIESPGKLKKLSSILGSDYIIKASFGHIRELAKDGEDNLGFELTNHGITCRYEPIHTRAQQVIKELKSIAKTCSEVIIASDPDREGESIGWHLSQVLGLKNPKRIVYQEITERAIRYAIANPRSLNSNLIEAGKARSCLDKLVGFKGSPLLWKAIAPKTSMGRVQSCVLHIVCEREKQISAFTPLDYYSLHVDYQEGYRAYYAGNVGEKTAELAISEKGDVGEDDKEADGKRITSSSVAEQIKQIGLSNPHRLVDITKKEVKKTPSPPFTTSSLQQVASAYLKFDPEKTMQVAQKLYEAGKITYMRTDSTALSTDFIKSVRQYLAEHDPNLLPSDPVNYKQGKNAQEAHEAIRPTSLTPTPEQLKNQLSDDEYRLDFLIWKRSIASQCKNAIVEQTKLLSVSGDVQWLGSGQRLIFAGYTKYWSNLSAENLLPELKVNQSLVPKSVESVKKRTSPPSRYSEAKLVAEMEKKGVGRPSTYASTVKLLKERSYVSVEKKHLVATELGLKIDRFMIEQFPELIDTSFTAKMEDSLDEIANGGLQWEKYLWGWYDSYFREAIARARTKFLPLEKSKTNMDSLQNNRLIMKPEDQTKKTVHICQDFVNPDEVTDLPCPKCQSPLFKQPSSSKKLAVPYFLKCHAANCDGVMFLNAKSNQWEAPGSKVSEIKKSDHACPNCRQPLLIREYEKDGQTKQMLVCSTKKCKDVAFFKTSQGSWWNKKFGNL
ncbi:type I DNA topoisomerase [Aphanothece hegewaldii CCALA 016]|uniref:DNA topoisomerase 1 n=1 Tax=Aphanothece hegewaldii CCALA 016 TaxID=2107694 RepID=A0A2T1LVW3_9CHRO|nr:type I DNA topoisomerase [Aphanothece hegewaldii]PSF35765.1 type I DNA topoisomerase [Aphanothece hegewaldii CCALA 016]